MRVYFISVWTSLEDLARRIQTGLNDSALVVVKKLNLTRIDFDDLLRRFGTTQMADLDSSGKLHFDGLEQLPMNQFLPLTFLYQVEPSRADSVHFQSLHDLFMWMRQTSGLRRKPWEYMTGVYQNGSASFRSHLTRISPHSGFGYLLIDQLSTVDLEIPENLENPYEGVLLLQQYRKGFDLTHRYSHIWEPNDLLIWSNESLIHSWITEVSNQQGFWRGLVWDNHASRRNFLIG